MDECQWCVVVEENVGCVKEQRWEPTRSRLVGDLAAARAKALHLARTYRPHHPSKERGRRVLRVGENSYLVILSGRWSDFHFRVHVGELVTDSSPQEG